MGFIFFIESGDPFSAATKLLDKAVKAAAAKMTTQIQFPNTTRACRDLQKSS
jgi:hypothetical protein